MIDKEKIPEPLLNEMIDLFGEDNTEKIAKRLGYNYHALVWRTTDEKIKQKIGIRIFPLFVIIIIGIFLLNIFI